MTERFTRPESDAHLSDLLRAWRQREGLSNLQAGHRLGAWPQGYRYWERGEHFPAPARWRALCDALDLTAEDMVRLEAAHRAQRARAAG